MRLMMFGRSPARSALPELVGGLERFHSEERLQAILSRERARTERTGRHFSVAVFRLIDRNQCPEAIREIAHTLLQRARITDDVGQYGRNAVAAVLPETNLAGGRKFASDVLEELGTFASRIVLTVYSYPEHDPNHLLRPGDAAASHHQGRDCIPALSDAPHSESHFATRSVHPWRGASGSAPVRVPPRRPEFLHLPSMPRWKRGIDIVGATVGLILTSPVLLAAAALVRLSGPGPVFFMQMRTGRGSRPFRIYKLRTMRKDAEHLKDLLKHASEQDGPAFKLRDDPRVTRIGRLLRKSSIDELPQLWNVLKGDMSLVGPRPLPCSEAASCHWWQRRRHDVTPGLTCIWQVRGRSRVSFEEWMRMDLKYIRRLGLMQDLALLLQTIPAVLLRRGAC